MITTVNAKLNLGLRILRKRADGYHDLETVFYPVGLYNGTPACPYPFCDVLEIIPSETPTSLEIIGYKNVTSDPHLNIVWKAYEEFLKICDQKKITLPSLQIILAKYLPVQAGLGGGSADGTFTLRLLNKLTGNPLSEAELHTIATRLGADCPFFLLNKPALAHGIGERLNALPPRLKGKWAVIAKPRQAISTALAFGNIRPHGSEGELEDIYLNPFDHWKDMMHNDFEEVFAGIHPECMAIKEIMYASGSFYASLSGSGSAFFGLYHDHSAASAAMNMIPSELAPYKTICLL